MESAFLGSLNLGILVEKEIVVHTNSKAHGDVVASHPSSVVSIVRSTSDLKREARTIELRKTTSSLTSGKMLPRTDVSEYHRRDLAEFFRSAPPPGHFMSIPDDASISSADGKWGVFKVFRKKRKRRKRQPPVIKLPDSAVSARTAGGHRHIAISVPTNYPHSGNVSLQQPTSGSMDPGFHQAIISASNQVSGRGMKTAGPVTEDHESLSSASLAPRSVTYQEETTRLAPPPRKISMLSTVPSQEEPSSGKGKERESSVARRAPMSPLGSIDTPRAERGDPLLQNEQHARTPEPGGVEITPKVIEIPSRQRSGKSTQQKQIPQASNEPTTSDSSAAKNMPSGTTHILSATRLSAPTPPTRTSSKRARTTAAGPDQIRNAASRLAAASRSAGSRHGGTGIGDGHDGPRGSFAESLMTDSSPKLFKAETATAYQSVPIVVRPPSHQEVESPLNLNFPTPPTNRGGPLVQGDLLSPSAASGRAISRKDRVKERKERDMEKLKAQLRQLQSPASHLKPEMPTEHLLPESPILGKFNEELGSSSKSRPFLAAQMSETGPNRTSHLKSPYLSPETVLKKRRARSISVPVMASSSSPSPLGSPMPWEGSTAYYRRREREAEREENEARRVRYAAQALAEEKETWDRISHQKLLRRYERLRENRSRDMEKRLHRLERNGEMLMQSMVSLMETLNKVLQDRHSLRREASAYHTTTHVQQPHARRRHTSDPKRTQSLRSARSNDNPLEGLRSQPGEKDHRFRKYRPSPLHLYDQKSGFKTERDPGQVGGEEGGSGTQVSQSALEALQEHLRSQSRRTSRVPGGSGYTSISSSSDNSNDAGSLEIMEPLMRELQEAARFGDEGRHAEEGRMPLTESEVFNLF